MLSLNAERFLKILGSQKLVNEAMIGGHLSFYVGLELADLDFSRVSIIIARTVSRGFLSASMTSPFRFGDATTASEGALALDLDQASEPQQSCAVAVGTLVTVERSKGAATGRQAPAEKASKPYPGSDRRGTSAGNRWCGQPLGRIN